MSNRFLSLPQERAWSRTQMYGFEVIFFFVFLIDQFHVAWVYFLALFVFMQAFFVILQDELGPTFFLPARVSFYLSISSLKLLTNVCVSIPLWRLMTIIPHYHFLTPNCRKSLLGIVPSVWTPLWLIHHCVGGPNHPISEEIGTTKDLALWKEIVLELMWRLRGIITVLPHALIYSWVGLFRSLLSLLNLLLYDSTLNVWKRSVPCYFHTTNN